MLGVYVRVSKEEQNVSEQIKQGTAYAVLQGLEYRIYSDEGVSGSIPMHGRKAGSKLLHDIASGGISSVWVQRVDRISRELLQSLGFWRLIEIKNAKIISGYEGVFEVGDGDKYFIYCLNSLLAERERMILIKRTNDGIARARREGKKIGGGKKGRKWRR